jgi:hypothetical protein
MIEAMTLSGDCVIGGIIIGVGLALNIPVFVDVPLTSVSAWSIIMALRSPPPWASFSESIRRARQCSRTISGHYGMST